MHLGDPSTIQAPLNDAWMQHAVQRLTITHSQGPSSLRGRNVWKVREHHEISIFSVDPISSHALPDHLCESSAPRHDEAALRTTPRVLLVSHHIIGAIHAEMYEGQTWPLRTQQWQVVAFSLLASEPRLVPDGQLNEVPPCTKVQACSPRFCNLSLTRPSPFKETKPSTALKVSNRAGARLPSSRRSTRFASEKQSTWASVMGQSDPRRVTTATFWPSGSASNNGTMLGGSAAVKVWWSSAVGAQLSCHMRHALPWSPHWNSTKSSKV
eukprot:CAMPEP_0194547520 /NCGR_PEP_ID=MMETSP0253-20130528/92272_1 /TAXON_ID=2966 /ORGANISM="Noctiluca scintillans" /LENGTH=267 /DNA_ID=CAMNT_0039394735 /DNA_START=20 /DNA_END=824 /DNA_ORIENTATION=-